MNDLQCTSFHLLLITIFCEFCKIEIAICSLVHIEDYAILCLTDALYMSSDYSCSYSLSDLKTGDLFIIFDGVGVLKKSGEAVLKSSANPSARACCVSYELYFIVSLCILCRILDFRQRLLIIIC